MKDTFTQAIRLGIIILLLACVLGWADAVFFAPRRLPVCVQSKLPEGRICLETLRSRHQDRCQDAQAPQGLFLQSFHPHPPFFFILPQASFVCNHWLCNSPLLDTGWVPW